MKKQKLYFAHPVNVYDEPIEQQMISLVQAWFPDYEIENPNQPCHQKGYTEWKEKYGNGMRYFYEIVLPSCKAGCVAMPFLDGLLGAGVAGEVIWYLARNMRTYLIEPPKLTTIREFNDDEKRLMFEWDKMKDETKEKIIREDIGNRLVLSIADTRKRTWQILYKTMRKYEKAHFI